MNGTAQLEDSQWLAQTLPEKPPPRAKALDWKHAPDSQFRYGVIELLSNGQPASFGARWFTAKNRALGYGQLTHLSFAVMTYYVKTRQSLQSRKKRRHPTNPQSD